MWHARSAALCAALLTAAFVASGAPRPAWASCGLVGAPPANPYAGYPVVFVGTVTAAAHEGRLATVRVEEIWAGPPLPAEVEVLGTSAEALSPPPGMGIAILTDRHFEAGRRYVFAPSGSPPRFQDGACSATAPFDAQRAALRPAAPAAAAGVGSAVTERRGNPAVLAAAGGGGPDQRLAIGGGAAAAAGVGTAVWARRRNSAA